MSTTEPTLLPLPRGWAAEAAPHGIVALARRGTILWANPALERLLGAGPGELNGRSARDFHPVPELALALARDRRVGSRIDGVELGLQALDGREVSVRVSASLLDDAPAGTALVAVVEDISKARVRESAELQARTMSAVGRLAGGMAHHFNNLIASILGHADLLGATMAPDAEGRSELEAITSAARRAKEIADHMLVVSGREVGGRAQVELGRWIYESAVSVREGIPQDVELLVRAESGEHRAWIDPVRLGQVLRALVANAHEALPGGGTILLEVGRWRPSESGDAHLFSPPPRPLDYLCLTVADDGMGMNEETLERALEPFFSTKRDREGAGLGLATVYGIVAQAGGHVAIESSPVVGTRVRVLLPEYGSESAAPRPAAPLAADGWPDPRGVDGQGATPPAPTLAGPTPSTADVISAEPPDAPTVAGEFEDGGPDLRAVLVVDDEESIREVMRKVLTRAGYVVHVAEDGREAQRVFQTARETVDMVVTDVMMPRMNGAELLEWLARESPGTATLMVSGFVGSPLVQPWVDRDPSSFLAKPFEAPEFLDRVRARWRLHRARFSESTL